MSSRADREFHRDMVASADRLKREIGSNSTRIIHVIRTRGGVGTGLAELNNAKADGDIAKKLHKNLALSLRRPMTSWTMRSCRPNRSRCGAAGRFRQVRQGWPEGSAADVEPASRAPACETSAHIARGREIDSRARPILSAAEGQKTLGIAADIRCPRPSAYLDQWVWVRLAKAALGRPKEPGDLAVFEAVRDAADAGVALPLSATHYIETSRIADPRRRRDLAAVMAPMSRVLNLMHGGGLIRHWRYMTASSGQRSGHNPRTFSASAQAGRR
jgi:hypothetical protein